MLPRARLLCTGKRGKLELTCVGRTVSRPRGIDILLAAPPAAPRRPPAPHHPPTRHYGPARRPRPTRPTDAFDHQEKHFPENDPTSFFTNDGKNILISQENFHSHQTIREHNKKSEKEIKDERNDNAARTPDRHPPR